MPDGKMLRIPLTSLEKPRSAHTLRRQWLMNEQQRVEIAERLRELRDNSPETNRSIADYVAVSERTVAAWAGAEQGMTYDHAKKVAELFEVEIDWLWRGRDSEAPAPDLNQRLADLETTVGELVDELRADRAVQIAKAAGQEKRESRQPRRAERPAKRKTAASG